MFFAVFVLAILMTGCAPDPQAKVTEPICTTTDDISLVMANAEAVLAGMNFSVDKADTNRGLLSTHPLTAAQSFEIWRKDNVGSFNSAEANMHTIRRIVEMNIKKNNSRLCIDCAVYVERMSLPEREITSTASAAGAFTRSSATMQQLELNRQQQSQMTWIPLGRDSELEVEILNQLNNKL